ncbi:hypothetical protein SRHO_G00163530 [Serrasalmus rhombeus]
MYFIDPTRIDPYVILLPSLGAAEHCHHSSTTWDSGGVTGLPKDTNRVATEWKKQVAALITAPLNGHLNSFSSSHEYDSEMKHPSQWLREYTIHPRRVFSSRRMRRRLQHLQDEIKASRRAQCGSETTSTRHSA